VILKTGWLIKLIVMYPNEESLLGPENLRLDVEGTAVGALVHLEQVLVVLGDGLHVLGVIYVEDLLGLLQRHAYKGDRSVSTGI